jgi:hypothetical protein
MAKRTHTPEELEEDNVDIDNEDEGGRFMNTQKDDDVSDVDDDEDIDTGDGTMHGARSNQGTDQDRNPGQGKGATQGGNQGQGKGATQGGMGGSRSTQGNQSGQQSGGSKSSQSNPKKK